MTAADREAALLKFINETPILLSLLYDLDLLPEQLKEHTHDWWRMLTVANHFSKAMGKEMGSRTK